MKGIIFNVIFIYYFVRSDGCKVDWDPTCKTNKDCCSQRCYKEQTWENGFCISGKTEPPKFSKCAEDYFDRCIVNEHCCSKLCNRSPYDQFGTCTPREVVLPVPSNGTMVAKCENDGYNKCINNDQCCSGICEKSQFQKIGTCKPTPIDSKKECSTYGASSCVSDKQCCTGICRKEKGQESGICSSVEIVNPVSAPALYATLAPYPNITPFKKKCQKDWFNQCTSHDQCCSGNCKMEGNWKYGVCTPKAPPLLNSNLQCQKNWFNKCTDHNQCCSGYCELEGNWKFGVCKSIDQKPIEPPQTINCAPDWSNQCLNHEECCSGLCERQDQLNYGICIPKNSGFDPKVDYRFNLNTKEEPKNIPARNCGKKIIGYYTSWGDDILKKSTVAKFTHIIFTYFEVEENGNVKLGNPYPSPTSSNAEIRKISESRLNHLLNFKKEIPGLKIIFSVGGSGNSQYFSKIAAGNYLKNTFIASILRNLKNYELDGVDIDWEHPVLGTAVPGRGADKLNYVRLLSDLRLALDRDAQKSGREKYSLSFAGPAGEKALIGYDLPGLLKYADWVNVQSLDFYVLWGSEYGNYTGPISPLYHHAPKGFSDKFNVNWAITNYACKLKSQQIVMGIPLYGRFWQNVPEMSGEYSIYRKSRIGKKLTEGEMVYWKDIKRDWLSNPKFKKYFDDKAKASYLYNSNEGTLLSYESPESIQEKIKFAKERNLGGFIVYEIGMDDDDNLLIDLISSANICTNIENSSIKCA